VTEHGGTICARNMPPRGACFTIALPFQSVTKQKEPVPAHVVPAEREGRILLVDQDESVVEAVSALLRGRAHAVRTARSAAEAKALLQEHEFDLIVADLQVHGGAHGSGFGLWLEAWKPVLAQRLVLMRAVELPGGGAEDSTHGTNHILQKPFKASDLLAAVDAVLGQMHAAPIGR
jgi:two-component system phosphate regulon response regulator OmpR